MRTVLARWMACAIAAAIAGSAVCADSPKWTELFDGKTLDGWIQRGGKARYFAKDGMIVGESVTTTPNSFLCTRKLYGDFVLELDINDDLGLNSGVQIRSESRMEKDLDRVFGYQVEVNPDLPKSGAIYDEGRRKVYITDYKANPAAHETFRAGEWNHYRIETRGDTFRTWIKGVPTALLVDDLTSCGFIGLQVHQTTSTVPMHARFKNLKLQELTQKSESPVEGDAFAGDWVADGGSPALQVIPLGEKKYSGVLLPGLDVKTSEVATLQGTAEGNALLLKGSNVVITIDNTAVVKSGGAEPVGLNHVKRFSPSLGTPPPEGATVLFDGKSMDKWESVDGSPSKWKLTDGAMEITSGSPSLRTKEPLGDVQLHVEFRSPLMADKNGQARGNSGVYLQGCYEIQILDSYGLEGKDNECGGIYKVASPRINMCAPPTQWQTYDITFRMPVFGPDGKKEHNASVTALHNGVVIHRDLELPGPTAGAFVQGEPTQPAALALQNHGDKVQFRNIWYTKLPPRAAAAPEAPKQ